MGYTTYFEGGLNFNKPVEPQHRHYINEFNRTRRMKRDPEKCSGMADPARVEAGLPIGHQGGYFTGGEGFAGQDDDDSIVDYNDPADDQPGLWCKWEITEDNTLEWDGAEKFYNYVDWLRYLIKHFLAPWGYVLNGEIKWEGENREDQGVIICKDNVVTTERIVHVRLQESEIPESIGPVSDKLEEEAMTDAAQLLRKIQEAKDQL